MAYKHPLTDKYRAAALEDKPKRGNLIDDMLGSAMKLPEIMKVLEQRDAEKNKGWFGIDRRTIDEVTKGLMSGTGKFEDAIQRIGPSLDKADARRQGAIQNEFATVLNLSQEAQKQRQLDEAKEHEVSRDLLKGELAEDAAAKAHQYAKELESYKKHLERKGTLPGADGMFLLKDLDNDGRKMFFKELHELNTSAVYADRALGKYAELDRRSKELEERGLTGIKRFSEKFGTLSQEDRGLIKLYDTAYANIIRDYENMSAGGNLKANVVELMKRELPDFNTPYSAAKEIIERHKKFAQEIIGQNNFYNKQLQQGKAANGYAFLQEEEGKKKKEVLEDKRKELEALRASQGGE